METGTGSAFWVGKICWKIVHRKCFVLKDAWWIGCLKIGKVEYYGFWIVGASFLQDLMNFSKAPLNIFKKLSPLKASQRSH
jgi:hypothetical protein